VKIALFGATGRIGSRVLAEALSRGHQVIAVLRDPSKLAARPNLTVVRGDVADAAGTAAFIGGVEAVISAVRFTSADAATIMAPVKQAGVKRLLVVGGAGSLEASPGIQLFDTPTFPETAKRESGAGRIFLGVLRGERELDWTFLSPSALIEPGERTGTFRLGGDQLLRAADGSSRITMEDYAIAMVDELEQARHSRRRFTVGY
jgi:putative NADH-flavin reductase